MKNFTEDDVEKEGQFPRIYVDRDDLKYAPLWWHMQGISQTASGYGGKLVNAFKISFCGRVYRLYTTCYSNSGTTWFTTKGRRIFVN